MCDFYLARKAANGAAGLDLDGKELAAINAYTMREYAAAELFAFKVTMCDNEVDRDAEAFTVSSLQKLAALFKGKTVIMNHQRNADNQCARIYATVVIRDTEKKTSYGEPYTRLEARCYIPRSEDTQALIGSIESGILKEVSVGCSVERKLCAICGEPYLSSMCEHQSGVSYEGGKRCFVKLDEPRDAYELSFVAVPAQTSAGVTKGMDSSRPEISFRAELAGLACMVKEIGAAMRRIEQGASQEGLSPGRGQPDLKTERLILESKALIQKIKGEMQE